MMDITYRRRRMQIMALGHAGYAPAGQDVVCAAATMLLYTLAGNLRKLHRNDPKRYYGTRIRLTPGFAVVEARARYDARITTMLIFDAIANGFRMLAKSYPQYVRFTQVD